MKIIDNFVDIDGNKIKIFDWIDLYVSATLSLIKSNGERFGKHHTKELGLVHSNKELRTLKISLPRQSGNTMMAMLIFKELENACLLVRNSRDRTWYIERYGIESNDIYTKVEGMKSKKIDYVIVDTRTKISNEEVEKIYTMKIKFIIFIQ